MRIEVFERIGIFHRYPEMELLPVRIGTSKKITSLMISYSPCLTSRLNVLFLLKYSSTLRWVLNALLIYCREEGLLNRILLIAELIIEYGVGDEGLCIAMPFEYDAAFKNFVVDRYGYGRYERAMMPSTAWEGILQMRKNPRMWSMRNASK